jgi:DNA invertase Pin-like site-specific DNA recombinase
VSSQPVAGIRGDALSRVLCVRPLLVAIFGWVAEQERTRLIERTKAGLQRARREGNRLGRPPASPVLLHAARNLVTAGVPIAEAARQKGVARSTLQRFLQARTA